MKKRFGRIGALAAAAALAVGLGGAPAMADDTDATAITAVPFSKTLYVGSDVNYNTAWEFTFNVAPYSVKTPPTDAANYPENDEIYPGVEGGLAAPTAVTAAEAVAGTGAARQNLAIDPSVFTEPGIYRYLVTENAGTVYGMTYDSDQHIVDLYVQYDDSGSGALHVTNVIVSSPNGAKEDDGDAHSDANFGGVRFQNTYASAGDPDIPGDNPAGSLHDVTVSKTVTGNQGDHTKEFSFLVTYDTQNSVPLKYKKNDGAWQDIANGGTVTLHHGETFILGGLAAGDTYTVTETQDANYRGKLNAGDWEDAGDNVSTGEQTMASAHVTDAFTNNRAGSIPTGIFINYKAYWILGGAALVLAFGLTRRRGLREEL